MWSFFSEWLLFSSTISSRQNYMTPCACTSFFSTPINGILLSVGGRWGWFCFLDIRNNAAMNVHVQVSVLCYFTFPPTVRVPTSLHPHWYFSLLIFLRVSSLADVNGYLTVGLISLSASFQACSSHLYRKNTCSDLLTVLKIRLAFLKFNISFVSQAYWQYIINLF